MKINSIIDICILDFVLQQIKDVGEQTSIQNVYNNQIILGTDHST